MTKPYSPPTLTAYGSVSRLTAAGSGVAIEDSANPNAGNESNSRNKRP